ncbi:hypothetical protein BDZ89DRAFT_1086828 [Hymenopellis radicata]|nr:hypothetical protein BDZ89DRAFT_1086828 [Hymenopellis radicata]
MSVEGVDEVARSLGDIGYNSKRAEDDGKGESEAREKSREFLSDRISAAGRSRPLLFLILCAF